jgi:glucose-6-phosphate 1-epimerase
MATATAIRTIVHSSSGASIKIHPYGATVLSYVAGIPTTTTTNEDGSTLRELLFVSDHAVLDGTKPIRGGIPLVFPIFGPPPPPSSSSSKDGTIVDTMPQHGFARRSIWTVIDEYDQPDGAGIVLELICRTQPNSSSDVLIPPDAIGAGNGWSEGLYECT